MCNRAEDQFTPHARQDLTRLFGDIFTWSAPRERIHPTDPLLTVRLQDGTFAAAGLRWGLIPPGKTPQDLKRVTTTNARVETLAEKPTYRGAFLARRRCVVPLSAFYEPDASHTPKKGERKRWHRVHRPDDRPLLAAGLWEVTVTSDGPLESVTVVTREPVPDLDVHDRMPALLLTKDLDAWLRGTPDQALEAAGTSWTPGLLVHTTA